MSRFVETELSSVLIVEPDWVVDERGWFVRTYCRAEFAENGVEFLPAQASLSYNERRGTLRGMHYQAEPFAETKLVRCVRGAIHDVLLDLRPGRDTFRQWVAVELTEENQRGVLVPPGVAHGFQTLVDHTVVAYQIAPDYSPEHARGVRFDDPAFAIEWPLAVSVISERDRAYESFAS